MNQERTARKNLNQDQMHGYKSTNGVTCSLLDIFQIFIFYIPNMFQGLFNSKDQ